MNELSVNILTSNQTNDMVNYDFDFITKDDCMHSCVYLTVIKLYITKEWKT